MIKNTNSIKQLPNIIIFWAFHPCSLCTKYLLFWLQHFSCPAKVSCPPQICQSVADKGC